MKNPYALFRLLGAGLLFSLLAWTGCREETGPQPLPDDLDPAITVVAPTSGNILQREGQDVTVSLEMSDAEQLRLLRVVVDVFDQGGAQVVADSIFFENPLSGTRQAYDYVLTVPTFYEPYFKMRFTCYVLDSKGASASTFFWVSILPEPNDPSPFQVLTYTDNFIVNGLSGTRFAFNFTQRANMPMSQGGGNVLDFDIAENSGSGRGLWEPTLGSPNNNSLGLDSVFVVTDPSRFNYEAATYESMYRAFFSDPAPATQTPKLGSQLRTSGVDTLSVQYVIVRLTKSPMPQFAAMKLNRLGDDGAGTTRVSDTLFFDYKVTSE
jgi:hypothetical protein